MRIGIYGGSFNPIHRGHTALAKSLIRQKLVDEVWLMVSPLNPLKAGETHETLQPTYDQRLRMVRLATYDMEGVIASDFERTLPLPSYTITTLHELSRQYPEHEFSLVIGADNWQRFARWHRHEEILRDYSLIVFHRPSYDTSGIALPDNARIIFAHTPLYDVSSTEIRERIKKAEDTKGMINKKVFLFIQKHLLYI
ncbi:MAG: nicotinate (nicotinamide) nucleotide adenylyltransferase [Bacteroidaceae bacterium]|nr:nicotinate (nicotinamide) nucleotide adenylyltransferase [Bacteroidaceae bacterium]